MRKCKEVELHPMEVDFNSERFNDSLVSLVPTKVDATGSTMHNLATPEKPCFLDVGGWR